MCKKKINIFVTDLTTILAALSAEDKHDECIKHALRVRSAWWLGNFHAFFKLYTSAPRMAAFLMDWFVARERKNALKSMIKSYVQDSLEIIIYLYSKYLRTIFIYDIFTISQNIKKYNRLKYNYNLVLTGIFNW